MTSSPNGQCAQLHRDVADITMDMASVEQLDLHTLAGADRVTVNDPDGH